MLLDNCMNVNKLTAVRVTLEANLILCAEPQEHLGLRMHTKDCKFVLLEYSLIAEC